MLRVVFLVAYTLVLTGSVTHAAVVEKTFHDAWQDYRNNRKEFSVGNLTISPLCESRVITAVNGIFPGPTIEVHEGDTVVVHVINESPYNITIHWHGIFQLLSAWADGPNYITQCPILPGNKYTYRFNVTGQEGTLWWHAHVSFLRATAHGALIIRPKAGLSYPFPIPCKEVPIILGEWWNANVVDVENEAQASGAAPNISDAFTINGMPGDLYECSRKQTYKLIVVPGKAYMLRIINAALNNQIFFKVAGHTFKVVAVDASYTIPYTTDVVAIAPGQTVDAIMVANARPSRYYMAALAYASAAGVPFDNTTTTGIVEYEFAVPSSTPPVMPAMPAFNETPTAHRFYSNLTALLLPRQPTVPLQADEKMFVTFGLGLVPCGANATCRGINGQRFAASMNNVSFQFPTKMSLLEAHFKGVKGVYSADFPDNPPLVFDYTNSNLSANQALSMTVKGTRLKKVKYNATVEMVLQNTALIGLENHPLHLHGFNFFVLAQGFGNYDASVAGKSFNLVNPQVRNTIAVPAGGWAVIRFIANNPGVWIVHCHLDVHLPWGLATAFEVENGPTPSSILPPPPPDFPRC